MTDAPECFQPVFEEALAAERYEAGMYKCLYDVWEKRASKAEGQVRDLMDAMLQAIDLLTERTQGSIARSPGHNARVRLESALSALTRPDRKTQP